MRLTAAAAAVVVVAAASGISPAAAQGPPPPAAVAFVGDSIGRDAEPEITAAVEATNPVAYFHAAAAGHIDYHLPRLRPIVADPAGPDIVVAELGTGDAFWSTSPAEFEADVRRFLDAVTPHTTCVIWVDQKPAGNRAYPMINQRAAAFNRVIHRVVPTYPTARWVHYAAWTRLAGTPSRFFLDDWLHLTAAGEADLARLVASAVRGCANPGPFWDVAADNPHAPAVTWAASVGISGYANRTFRTSIGRFRPLLRRVDAASWAWTAAGRPAVTAPHPWTDTTAAAAPALRWAHQLGMRTPTPRRFAPTDPITSGDWLHLLWAAAGSPAPQPPHPWADTHTAGAQRAAARWAAAAGVVTPTGALDPAAPINRGLAVTWLHNTAAPTNPQPANTE